jgi:pimeloyl-ACP methyl ester carboxylesterase
MLVRMVLHFKLALSGLGFTFRARRARSRAGVNFTGFGHAISKDALTKVSAQARRWRLHVHTGHTLAELARTVNPIVRGWMQYTGRSRRNRSRKRGLAGRVEALPEGLPSSAQCARLAMQVAGRTPGPTVGGVPMTTARTFDPELTGYGYPRAVQFYEFQDQDQTLRMAYMYAEPESGNEGSVLLLHGKNFSGAYWEPTIRELLGKGFRVIAPDQIGFGKSSKPHCYQFSFQALAQNTRGLLDLLNADRVHVVGHSMGGMLATRFALMYPERTGKLALVNPIGLEDWKALGVPYRTVDENYAVELKTTPETIREYLRVSYFGGEWKPEYDALIEVLAGWSKDPEYPIVAWDSALTSDMIFTQPVVYEFPLVAASTLLIIGQRDRTAFAGPWVSEDVRASLGNYPVLGRAAARAFQHAKLVEIAGAGHLPQVEAFDQYREALLGFVSSGGDH